MRNISIGIDVGTQTTRVVVAEFLKGEKNPKIVGVGEVPTLGMRHGYITEFEETVKSIKRAVLEAEKTSGIKIKRAFVSLSGVTLRAVASSGVAIISKADGEVTALDVNKALADCEENLNLNNKKVIQISPLSHRLDGVEVLGRLEGMRGNKLEVKALFVTYSTVHLEDLVTAISRAGVETIDVIPAAVAASYIALSEKQKIVGSALVNIGSETVSLAVFENGSLLSAHTFSIGGADITNDIALGLKIPLENAESFKLGNIDGEHSKKKLDEIIEARFTDIFELLDTHLKKIKRSELLPAGAIFVGGGANTLGLPEFAKEELGLPSTLGTTEIFGSLKTKLRDPSWFTVLGLVVGGRENDNFENGTFGGIFKDLKNTIKGSLKQLMP
ncbi:MAG TPA: cell division protein FtsA [Candidatus Paceibacterota bacterium]